MKIFDFFYSYFFYLIHPYKSHDAFIANTENDIQIKHLSVYESLGASWIFIVLNGVMRIALINFVIFIFINYTESRSGLFSLISDGDNFLGFYFLILSTVLDVIFFPLFTLFLIQFWEFVIRMFGQLLGNQENLETKARNIMTVALSSNVLVIIPILGSMAQKLAALFLMYAGLRRQLNASPFLSVCIMMFPVLMGLAFFSLIMLVVVIKLM